AGRVARIVLGVVLLLLGAVVVLLALPSVLDPLAGTRGAVSTATGLIGHAPSAGRGTAWPLVAAVAGVLAALAGFGVLVLSPGWPTGGGRYRQQGVPSARRSDPVDEWDALTAGTDPTHDEDAAGPPPSATP
ncbi:MAG: Trp biosynthesis-associated membrane protein, partial [Amnibacterium sp.]